MKIFFLLSAFLASPIAFAQTDSLIDKNNPAHQLATPHTGVTDKNVSGHKETHRIEPEKNTETVKKIKQRAAERKQKNIKKYKGKKSNVSKTQQ